MFDSRETPSPQKAYGDLEKELVIPTVFILKEIAEGLKIVPENVKTVTVLGAGRGIDVSANLKVFPKAIVHAIDFHDLLPPSLKTNPRVVFHQGLFIKVLESPAVPPADITFCKFMGSRHGFDPTTIALLQKATGDGFLIMCGDNGLLEIQPHFTDKFVLIKDFDRFDATVWKAKGERKLG